jgi:ethanolamine ammonia-lyase small subunit
MSEDLSLPGADIIAAVRQRTPARILVGRAGPSYRTTTQLELRQAHAAAVDAVQAEVDLERDLDRVVVERFGMFAVTTRAADKEQYLLRPDLGRLLSEEARQKVRSECPAGVDLQVVVGDGLSAAAVAAQVPGLLPLLANEAARRGWSFGRPFLVRHCRVGVLNNVGELLDPAVVVLLIGERPGLATAQSLSAYMAYRPRPGHSDAQRNLISNIHGRGVSQSDAARRIALLAEQMLRLRQSGVAIKEVLPALPEQARPSLSAPAQGLLTGGES